MTNIIAISGKIGSGKDTIGAIIQYLVEEENNKLVMSIEEYLESYDPNITTTGEWEIKKMAGKLKDVACLILGCTREDLEDRDFKEKELGKEWFYKMREDGRLCSMSEMPDESQYYVMTVREFLQKLGTNAMRVGLHPNIWVNAFWSDYKEIPDPKVIEFLKADGLPESMCGKFQLPNWIITDCRFPNEAESVKERDGIIIRVNRNSDNPNNHPSETGLDDYQDFDYVIDNNGTLEDLVREVRLILHKERLLKNK